MLEVGCLMDPQIRLLEAGKVLSVAVSPANLEARVHFLALWRFV
jgi:hypothetical protein